MPSIIYKKDDKEVVSDLLTKMLDDRVIMLMTPVNNISMTSVISQLLYLNVKDNNSPIHLKHFHLESLYIDVLVFYYL
jgi:ATP-dependent Clp protease protease subunit